MVVTDKRELFDKINVALNRYSRMKKLGKFILDFNMNNKVVHEEYEGRLMYLTGEMRGCFNYKIIPIFNESEESKEIKENYFFYKKFKKKLLNLSSIFESNEYLKNYINKNNKLLKRIIDGKELIYENIGFIDIKYKFNEIKNYLIDYISIDTESYKTIYHVVGHRSGIKSFKKIGEIIDSRVRTLFYLLENFDFKKEYKKLKKFKNFLILGADLKNPKSFKKIKSFNFNLKIPLIKGVKTPYNVFIGTQFDNLLEELQVLNFTFKGELYKVDGNFFSLLTQEKKYIWPYIKDLNIPKPRILSWTGYNYGVTLYRDVTLPRDKMMAKPFISSFMNRNERPSTLYDTCIFESNSILFNNTLNKIKSLNKINQKNKVKKEIKKI